MLSLGGMGGYASSSRASPLQGPMHGTAPEEPGQAQAQADAYMEQVALAALQGSHAAYALLRVGAVR